MVKEGHDEKGRFTSKNNYGGLNNPPGGCPRTYTEEWCEEEGERFVEWMRNEKNLFYKDFCIERDWLPQRIPEFCERSPRFAESFEKVKVLQESRILRGALVKKFSEGISARFLAKFGTLENTVKVVVQKEDPVSVAISEAMGKSKDLFNARTASTEQPSS